MLTKICVEALPKEPGEMYVREIKEELRSWGLDVSGQKEDLVKRLKEHRKLLGRLGAKRHAEAAESDAGKGRN